MKQHYSNEMTKVYFTFYHTGLPVCITSNKLAVWSAFDLLFALGATNIRVDCSVNSLSVIPVSKTREELFLSLNISVSKQQDDAQLSVATLTGSLTSKLWSCWMLVLPTSHKCTNSTMLFATFMQRHTNNVLNG